MKITIPTYNRAFAEDVLTIEDFINVINEEDETVFPYANQFGSGRVKNSFYLDTTTLLDVLHSLPEIHLRRESFDYTELNPAAGTYQGEHFNSIIFCEGYQSKHNPWFGTLPVDSTKGEILTVETEGLSHEESLNRKCFTLHTGNGRYKVGATYDWSDKTNTPTAAGKQELVDKLAELISCDYEILQHFAGVRPTVKDRRPLVGTHPEYPQLHVLNGLGTRGVMLGPYLANQLFHHIEENIPLEKEIDIIRCYKKNRN